MTVILALELSIAGLAYAFKSDLDTYTNRELKDSLVKFNWTDPNNKYSMIWNQIQGNFRCCGINSTNDWADLNPPPQDRSVVPDSCCPRPHVNESSLSHNNIWTMKAAPETGRCRSSSFFAENNFNRQQTSPTDTTPFKTGCAQHMIDTLFNLIAPLGLACLALGLFQILGIVFAFSLSKAVRQDYQVV